MEAINFTPNLTTSPSHHLNLISHHLTIKSHHLNISTSHHNKKWNIFYI